MFSGYEQRKVFYLPSFVKLAMEFTLVVAMCRVFLVDVGVAAFQFFIDSRTVDSTGTDVVGESAEQDCVSLAHVLVERNELIEVFSQEGIGLSFCELDPSPIWLATLYYMTVPYLGLIQSFR